MRQVIIVIGRTPGKAQKALERMKRKVDSQEGRDLIARRFATVEPVFGNIRYNKRLDRFTLRGQQKVDAQWKLYCLVHNIEKLANNGYAGQKAAKEGNEGTRKRCGPSAPAERRLLEVIDHALADARCARNCPIMSSMRSCKRIFLQPR